MGGHGGLNIIPQKSWNVYGQRQRQKVAEDEAAQAAKDAAQAEQQARASRERQLQRLKQGQVRSSNRRMCGACCSLAGGHAIAVLTALNLSLLERSWDRSAKDRSAAAFSVPFQTRYMIQGQGDVDSTPKEHINFWADFEDAAANPEEKVRCSWAC